MSEPEGTRGRPFAGGEVVALVALLGLALFLRAQDLTQGLWLDEFGTAWAAGADSLGGVSERVLEVHGQSPLYYVLVRLTTWVLGSSELTLRLPSLLAGVLTPLVVYVGLRPVSGRRTAAAAALLLTVHGVLAFQSGEARPYPLATLFLCVAAVSVGPALRSGRPRDRLLLWGSLTLAFYTHYLFLTGMGAALLAAVLARREPAYPPKRLLVDLALTLALWVPGALQLQALAKRKDDLVWVEHAAGQFVSLLLRNVVPGVLALGAVLLVVWGARRLNPGSGGPRWKGPEDRYAVAFAAAALVVHPLFLLVSSGQEFEVAAVRYLGVAMVAGCLLAGRAVATLPTAAALLALGACAYQAQGLVEFQQDYQEVAADLDAQSPADGEPVLVWSGFVESDRLVEQGHLSAVQRSFLLAPLAHRPGRAAPPGPLVPLTNRWGFTGSGEWLERELVPLLEGAERFHYYGHVGYLGYFQGWLERRLPGRFRAAGQGPLREFMVAAVFERR